MNDSYTWMNVKSLLSGLTDMKEIVVVKDVAVASPALAVTSMNFLGYPIADWAAVLSILWIIVLMVLKTIELCSKKKVK